MLRLPSAEECLATEFALAAIDEPWCGTRQPQTTDNTWILRALAALTRTHHQHQHLDTAPLLQECRSRASPMSIRPASSSTLCFASLRLSPYSRPWRRRSSAP